MKKLHFPIYFLFLLLLPVTVFGIESTDNRTIAVTSSYGMTVPAENATIHAQIKIVSDSVENSYNQVIQNLMELTERMKKFGLAKADITVSAITQGAEYKWTANTRKLSGYSATCSLQFQVGHIEDSYKMHTEFSTFPALTIQRTEYGLNDYSKIKAQTLQKALHAAKEKATVMSEAMDAAIGEVLTISEVGSHPLPIARAEAMMQNAGAPNPINVTTHGSVTVNSSVAVVFALQ